MNKKELRKYIVKDKNISGLTFDKYAENVENMTVTPTGNVVVNLANTASTFSKLELASGGTSDLTFNDVAAVPGLIKSTNSNGNLTLNLKAGAVAGTSDTVAIELAGSQAAAEVIITDDSATGSIEAITIASTSAANTLKNIDENGATSITVTGDQSLSITDALGATVSTIDASGMTGAAGLTMAANHGATLGATITGSGGVDSLRGGGAAAVDNINAGAGNDTITMDNYTVKDSIDGGDGVDTVSLDNTAIASSTLGGLSNVEVVYSAAAATFTLTENVGPTVFSLGTANLNQVIYFNDDYSQDTTVLLTGDTDSADQIINNSGVNLTVKGESDDFAANITVITGHATAKDTLVITPTTAGDLGAGSTQISGIDEVQFARPATGVSGAVTMDFGDFATPVTITSALSALDGALTLDLSGGGTVTGTINYTGGANGDISKVIIRSTIFNMYKVFGAAKFGYSELTLS